ncbi:MAG TPA: beta-phosphoglucomutase family hydrolase [Verrucomicrobiales bacterium]|nr:beta-phosphoglucomutase family hydrolase [Verrucomicrobiales bacterium]HIL71358.1 beta-phosphoglucomutase family hydrolase [Verrucomicrobiota bacterium]
MNNVKGIVFDCDGTLADTMPLHWQAWQAVTEKNGIHFEEERFYALGGVPSADILRMLGEEQNVKLDPVAVAHEKELDYLPLLSQVQPIHDVVAIAKEYHGKLPMGVATGGTRKIITLVLEHLKIAHLFDALVTSEDIVNQKPAPDIFLLAAERIGVDPTSCRGYEDTDLGMQAIRSAGMEAVHVRDVIGKSHILPSRSL